MLCDNHHSILSHPSIYLTLAPSYHKLRKTIGPITNHVLCSWQFPFEIVLCKNSLLKFFFEICLFCVKPSSTPCILLPNTRTFSGTIRYKFYVKKGTFKIMDRLWKLRHLLIILVQFNETGIVVCLVFRLELSTDGDQERDKFLFLCHPVARCWGHMANYRNIDILLWWCQNSGKLFLKVRKGLETNGNSIKTLRI